jgi:subtilisin family serine protease
MKKFFPIIFLVLSVSLFAQDTKLKDGDYIKGVVVVKVKPGADLNFNVEIPGKYTDKLGMQPADDVMNQFGDFKVKKMFPHTSPPKPSMNREENVEIPDLSRIFRIEFDTLTPVEDVIKELKKIDDFEYVEPYILPKTNAIPMDELYETMEYFQTIDAEAAWENAKGEDSEYTVLVGISDSGTEWDHPDLFDNLWINEAEWTNKTEPIFLEDENGVKSINPAAVDGMDSDGNGFVDDVIGWNFVTWDGTVENEPKGTGRNAHGTHVAGTAAGVTNNGEGVASISWNVKFLPVKHGYNHPSVSIPSLWNIYEGLVYLADMGCDIINMSWGGGGFSELNLDVINYAYAKGSLLVAAAGNGNTNYPHFPSAYPNVISVASVAADDERAYYSNYGITVDIASIGGDQSGSGDGGVLSTVPGFDYAKFQGTSMASPLATGLLALMKSKFPEMSNDELTRRLYATSDNIDAKNPGFEGKLGEGRINANTAINGEEHAIRTEPRLDLFSFDFFDENMDGKFEAGEKVFVDIVIRNYNEYYGDPGFAVITTSESDFIVPNPQGVKVPVGPDDYLKSSDGYFEISPDAGTGVVTVEIRLQPSFTEEPLGIIETDLFIYNGSDGILIVDRQNSIYGPGTGWLPEYLEEKGINYFHVPFMPVVDGTNFDAVFYRGGFYIEDGNGSEIYWPEWNEEDFFRLAEFANDGGNVYIDGGIFEIMKNEFGLPTSDLFGLNSDTYTWINAGDWNNRAVGISGLENSIGWGMNFTQIIEPGTCFIDHLTPDTEKGGMTAFSEDNMGIGPFAVQTEGIYGQKVVASSLPLDMLTETDCPSNAWQIFDNILNFFEIYGPMSLNMEDVESCRGFSAEIGADLIECGPYRLNPIVAGGSGDYSYEWHPSKDLLFHNTLNPVLYQPLVDSYFTLNVTDNVTGKQVSGTMLLDVMDAPSINMPLFMFHQKNTPLNLNNLINSVDGGTAPYEFYWEDKNGAINDPTNLIPPIGVSRYYVHAVDDNGCFSLNKRLYVFVSPRKEITGDDVVAGANGTGIMYSYPNPVDDKLNIFAELDNSGGAIVKIVDILGNELMSYNAGFENTIEQTIDVSGLNRGVYFVVIETANDKLVKKFVK